MCNMRQPTPDADFPTYYIGAPVYYVERPKCYSGCSGRYAGKAVSDAAAS